jgi:hypothetical protein
MAPLLTRLGVGSLGGFGFGRRRGGSVPISATGGTISTPGDGYTYHTFAAPGTFTVILGNGEVEMVSIGGGGGGGGFDPPASGGGGGGGGISYATFLVNSQIPVLLVSIGGGGGGGASNVAGTGGGSAGSNGGGTGGAAGGNCCSGGGGGGGGWSGVYTPTTYYVVGAGGAGGGGANEGPANNIPALGGGNPSNTIRTDSLTGANGTNFSGDGGGYGGSGGGFNGATGGGGTGGTTHSGGANYNNPISLSSNLYAGGSGARPGAGSRAPGFLPANPSWSPVIPATVGNGGSGSGGPGSGGAGAPGIVIIRYLV